MIKAGILSMQRIYNYGSFLQAYGLKQILRELGCHVEFVDYHAGKCLISPDGGTGITRKISKVTEVFRYNAPLKEKLRFIKYKKNYAKNYYPYLKINENMNYSPELDILVIGSDEVFNCVQNNTNVGFSPELFGAENHAKKVISYAASFGNTTLEKLEKYNISSKISEWLKKFSTVSVRDENSGQIVEKLTGKKPVYNLDPVLAYDYIGKCRHIPSNVPESDYIILYGYSGRFTDEECHFIRKYADRKNLKVFCIGGVQNCCDKFIDCSPFEVIAYFQNASAVITDTFHGTIISIITHRPFASLVRNSGYGNSEKLGDLLKRLHLENRKINNIKMLGKILDTSFSFSETDQILFQERRHTYEYLKNQIESVRN